MDFFEIEKRTNLKKRKSIKLIGCFCLKIYFPPYRRETIGTGRETPVGSAELAQGR